MTTPQPSEEQPSLNDSKALDKRPEYGVLLTRPVVFRGYQRCSG